MVTCIKPSGTYARNFWRRGPDLTMFGLSNHNLVIVARRDRWDLARVSRHRRVRQAIWISFSLSTTSRRYLGIGIAIAMLPSNCWRRQVPRCRVLAYRHQPQPETGLRRVWFLPWLLLKPTKRQGPFFTSSRHRLLDTADRRPWHSSADNCKAQ